MSRVDHDPNLGGGHRGERVAPMAEEVVFDGRNGAVRTIHHGLDPVVADHLGISRHRVLLTLEQGFEVQLYAFDLGTTGQGYLQPLG